MDGVKISYKWSGLHRAYYINSCAGLIRFRPRGEDLSRFRDEYINRVLTLQQSESQGTNCTKALFKLYREIRAEYRVSYKANFRTRMRYCFSNR